MTVSARQIGIRTKIVVGFVLTLLLFASFGVDRAQATHGGYHREDFSCGGTHNSGAHDGNGNVYVPCGNPTTIRVYNDAGGKVRDIPLGFYASDVAPKWDGSALYVTQVVPSHKDANGNHVDGEATAVRRLVRQADGSYSLNDLKSGGTWKLGTYTRNGASYVAKGFKIATDAQGHVYVADGAGGNNDANGDELSTVVKYDANGNYVTHFGGNAKSGGAFYGLLAGIAVSEDGNRVYALEGNYNVAGSAEKGNHILRYDRPVGSTAYTRTQKWGGNYDPNVGCDYHEIGVSFSGTWLGYFAGPWDIGLDSAENLYVANATCREVLKFKPNFEFVMGMKVGGVNADEPMNLGKPHGVAVSKSGEVYVGEAGAKMDLPNGDTTAPTSTVSPALNAADVPIGTDVTATFNEAVDTSQMSFTLKRTSDGANVPGVQSYDGATRTAKFDPTSPLAAGIQYTATLSGVDDLAGNMATPNPRVWSFTTAAGEGEACSTTVNNGVGNLRMGDTNANTMNGDATNENFCGLGGNDVISPAGGDDKVDGGSGIDKLSYSMANAGVNINLTNRDAHDPGAQDAGIGVYDSPILNMENVQGSNHGDTIYGDGNANVLTGGDGADEFYGMAGNDTIHSADGISENVFCGNGTDKVIADTLDVVNADCENPIRDTTAPGGSIKINNGALYTNNLTASLALSANDGTDGSGVAKMSFSNDGSNWSEPVAFNATASRPLRNVQGSQKIYVKYIDSARNESVVEISDDITLDTVKPKIVFPTTPTNAGTLPAAYNVKATFNDAMLPGTLTNPKTFASTTFTLRKGSATGTLLSAKVTYSGKTATLDPTANLVAGQVYYATITTAARDKAGNPLDQNASLVGNQGYTWKFTAK